MFPNGPNGPGRHPPYPFMNPNPRANPLFGAPPPRAYLTGDPRRPGGVMVGPPLSPAAYAAPARAHSPPVRDTDPDLAAVQQQSLDDMQLEEIARISRAEHESEQLQVEAAMAQSMEEERLRLEAQERERKRQEDEARRQVREAEARRRREEEAAAAARTRVTDMDWQTTTNFESDPELAAAIEASLRHSAEEEQRRKTEADTLARLAVQARPAAGTRDRPVLIDDDYLRTDRIAQQLAEDQRRIEEADRRRRERDRLIGQQQALDAIRAAPRATIATTTRPGGGSSASEPSRRVSPALGPQAVQGTSARASSGERRSPTLIPRGTIPAAQPVSRNPAEAAAQMRADAEATRQAAVQTQRRREERARQDAIIEQNRRAREEQSRHMAEMDMALKAADQHEIATRQQQLDEDSRLARELFRADLLPPAATNAPSPFGLNPFAPPPAQAAQPRRLDDEEIARRQQQDIERRVRAEQDAEYLRGLEADRAKTAREAEERERERQQQLIEQRAREAEETERRLAQEQAEAEQRRVEAAAQAAANQVDMARLLRQTQYPLRDGDGPIQIKARLPDGRTIRRAFRPDQTVGHLFAWVDGEVEAGKTYSLSTAFPRRVLDQERAVIGESNLDNETLNVVLS